MSKSVDVLAFFDSLFVTQDSRYAQMREARAAVAELIAKADVATKNAHKKAGGGWWMVRNEDIDALRAALKAVSP